VNLQTWFNKGNSRRFHRVNLPVQCFITPKEPIYQRQIFALGIDYYPASTQHRIKKQKIELENRLAHLPSENKKIVQQVFYAIEHYFEIFLDAVIYASQGKDPRQQSIHWHSLVKTTQGIQEIEGLSTNSPKTYQYLKQITKKFSTFVAILVNSIERSNINHFSAPQPLPELDFKIDQLCKTLNQPQYHRVALAQSIIHLNHLMDLYIEVFANFYNDHFLKDYPRLWPMRDVNVSIGGIALKSPKSFELFSRVSVHLYFENQDIVLNFDGSVVKVDKERDSERIAINFELPESSLQDELQQLIYQHEVEETLAIKLPF